MTSSLSMKIRAIGGASALALTFGLAGTALAQSAPPPQGAAPTPTPPTVPANAEECAVVSGVLTCAPGFDADGFFDVSGTGLGLDIQDGAVVQNSIIVTGALTGTIDGAIFTTGDFEGALLAGLGSDVTINGVVQTTGDLANAIETEDNSTITNNGTIYTAGGNSNGVVLAQGSTLVNNGLLQTDGNFALGVVAFGDGATVTNSVTGSIFTSGTGSTAIEAANGATITNDGLIQTFAAQASGIIAGDDAVISNSGNLLTLGNLAAGITAGSGSSVNNSGFLGTTGNNFADGVVVGEGSTVTNSGSIEVQGDNSFGVFGNGASVDVTNTSTGSIFTDGAGGFAISLFSDSSVTNAGLIGTTGDFAFAVDAFDNAVISNTGSITTTGNSSVAISTTDGASITSDGTISTTGDDSIAIITGDGSTVSLGANSTIDTTGVNAGGIVMLGGGTVSNAGSITTTGDGAQGVTITGDATVTNDGSVSTAAATAFDLGGVTDLTNNGSISGTTGVNGAATAQTVANFGSITGTGGTAVALGDGADEYQHWTGASTTGDVDLGLGDDSFILEGTSSTIGGTVDGGDGTNLAIIAGLLDSENFANFQTYQIGSTLGGTLNDAVISGDRVLDGDVSIVGSVTLGLGVDTLTSTGDMTAEAGSTINVETPLDFALVGQTVTFLFADGTFTDNGATVNVVDDDLLIDYIVVDATTVQVVSDNPLLTSADPNVVVLGGALQNAVANGTLSAGTFALLNGLGSGQLEAAGLDALPSLSEGAAREIFETSNAASQALDRHLAGESSGIWGQFVVRGASQDGQLPSQGGYDSDQMIFTVGGDFAFGPNGRVGALVSYADIENDDFTGGATRGETEIESLKLGVYGGVTFLDQGFFNAELSYLTGDIDQSRTGLFGPIGSSFDFDGFAYKAVFGYDLLPDENVSITPSIGLNGANISFDDAVETGGFGFTVAREDADFFELRGGIELASEFSPGVSGFIGGTFVAELNDDVRTFTLSSTELGTFGVVTPEREGDRFELAAGATIAASGNVSIDVGYMGEFASGYDAHAGRASVRIAF